ncbi:MAG: hypothetical protein K1X67_01320 [Fimbriimonadaceae bacterium]|nr:hypothetical protein [Fimbriimonadaceae bacterium]
MEAPQAGTTLYLDGLPLARIEPLTDEDRAMIESTIRVQKRRRARAIVGVFVYWALFVAAFISAGLWRSSADLIQLIPVLTGPLLFAVRGIEPNPKALLKAQEKWIFEGTRSPFPAPAGLFCVERPLFRRWRKPPILMLQPGNILVESQRAIYPADSTRSSTVNTDSSSSDSLSEGGLREVKASLLRLLGQAGLSAIIAAGSLIGLAALLQHGFPLELWKQVLLSLCVVGLIDGVRTVWILGRRAYRLIKAERQTGLIRISVLSPAYSAIAHSTPELEGALRFVEVVESGLLWTVDGRPAAWRIYGVEPVLIKAAALELPVIGPASSQAAALPNTQTNDTRPST